ncbi:Multicopper oxidase with three cupredoxin domains (includes cell division protein FtsP and spore coat protein CotA) [Andreprevotia lacus DSM 23236]|jgi:FtsP/CotA-like multicopper oxidase with cupredoxin domain|uniref:Multicopper oxidase with three cupredoxin domains (Includes cell division protein FtsP and spore coat protein CotA) n=1 Tax=Andreprevotia lacus DSM 23236 TaxID=1121001 RepID=A0A1W1XU91_9NEIS|nr:multicopper oxidase domain-containing protein [Andreprevotia lacus]SMC27425.1 Multicopper oxidase with three cupredoxin domains (includes cell division protein FtsP and spore coat protein CotA) [Andreprevotia lacus DSM 23236]
MTTLPAPRYLAARLMLLGTLAGACAAPVLADEPQQVGNPPLLRAAPPLLAHAGHAKPRLNLLAKPLTTELAPGVPREVYFDLAIRYVNGWIRNPSVEKPGEVKYDKVQLRSYVQGDGSKAKPLDPPTTWGTPGQTVYVAPQIEAYPGQTVRITLNNDLPRDPSCLPQGGSANTPHCFNGTNLHSHGLWVNPAGNSDNVLLSINPGVGFQYEYNIPPTHPAGTFWYHTHQHGSTALQVSSGMAGALIVRGTRPPTPNENGDLDTLLKPYGNTTFPERVMVFQQIQYACRFASGPLAGQIKTYGNDPLPGEKPNPKDQRYKCDDGDVGAITAYDQFGPGTWESSGRYTSINGVVLGTLGKAKVGTIERWRMIHGGVRDTISLQIRRRTPGAPLLTALSAAATDEYVNRYCTGPALDLPLVAADGLTMAKALYKKTAVFQPGYRWDALVSFPQAGDYCVINNTEVTATIDRAAPSARLLGIVQAEGDGPAIANPKQYVLQKLAEAAKVNMPADVRQTVANDVLNNLTLTKFVPHQTITDDEVTGTQTLAFNIDTSVPGSAFFQVDGRPYDGSRIDRVLQLGAVDEWTLTSHFVSHPFHIHVNPFQVVKIIDPNGNDVSLENAVDGKDAQYPGLKGVWKDTLWIKDLYPSEEAPTRKQGMYTIVVRTRYERYIGDFVLHCHILDHEDQGMMQNIRIALPDGLGGTSQGHH